MGLFSYLFASDNKRSLMKIEKIVNQIEAKGEFYSAMSDEELQAQTPALKERLANGETMENILVDAFAVVLEAATPHDVIPECIYEPSAIIPSFCKSLTILSIINWFSTRKDNQFIWNIQMFNNLIYS